jgi:hypothetical protein
MIFCANTSESYFEKAGEEHRVQLYNYHNPVRTNEPPVSILIDDLFLPESYAVAPVQRADVTLHRFRHFLPVMLHCVRRESAQSFTLPDDLALQSLVPTQKDEFSWSTNTTFSCPGFKTTTQILPSFTKERAGS